MPEVFLEFLGNASPWLLLLLIPLYFWGKLNHDALHNHETHPESFKRVVGWLKENNLGLIYLKSLGWLLDKISELIGDRQKLSNVYVSAHPNVFFHKTFGFNPFTSESYEKCLRLAFLYPVLSFLIVWALGGTGQIGSVAWLGEQAKSVNILQGWQRLLLLGLMSFFVFLGFFSLKKWWHRRWLMLNVIFLSIGVVSYLFLFFGLGQDNVKLSESISLSKLITGWIVAWIIFSILHWGIKRGGSVTGWIFYRSSKQGQEEVYQAVFAIAVSVAVASSFVAVSLACENSSNISTMSTIGFSVAFAGIVIFFGADAFAVAVACAFILYFVFASITSPIEDAAKAERSDFVGGYDVIVDTVVSNTSAAQADLQIRDKILNVDSIVIFDKDTFIKYIQSHSNHPVSLKIERNGNILEREFVPRISLQMSVEAANGIKLRELARISTEDSLNAHYDIFVVKVIKSTPADEAGLKIKDKIIKVDSIEIPDGDALVKYVQAHADYPIILEIERSGNVHKMKLMPRINRQMNVKAATIGVQLKEVSHTKNTNASDVSLKHNNVTDSKSANSINSIVPVVMFIVLPMMGMVLGSLVALRKRSKRRNRLGWFWLVSNITIFVFGYATLGLSRSTNYMIWLLFWLLLPLVNTPLDWLSLGVTRGLLQAVRVGQHSGRETLLLAMLDLLLALLFLFLITAVLVGATAWGNAVSNKTLVDIGGILQTVRSDPASVNQWWIYFMLLSTLVPTLVHFALAGGAVILWLPRKWRLRLADGLERDVHKTFAAWAYLTFMPVIGFVLIPGTLLYFLWWLLNAHGGWLGTRLLGWADMLMRFADPAMQ